MAKKSKIRKNKKSFFHFGNDEILNLGPVFILVMREESALIGCSISHVTPHPLIETTPTRQPSSKVLPRSSSF